MSSWKTSLGLLLLGSAAALALVGASSPGPAPGSSGALQIRGRLQGPEVDQSRLEVRCARIGLDLDPIVARSAIDPGGRFALGPLADVDHRLEVVLRANPALVLARLEPVRPGAGELTLRCDAWTTFGPVPDPDPLLRDE